MEDAEDAPVPGIIQEVFPGYHGVAWYWLRFVPALPSEEEERIHLRFGAVDYFAEVWVNGIHAGSHEDGETPFAFDVTDSIRPGKENLIAVRVINPIEEPIDGIVLKETPHRHKRNRDYQPGSAYNHGGIMQDVLLINLPPTRIVDVYAKPCIESERIELRIAVRHDGDRAVEGRLMATAIAGTGGEAHYAVERPVTAAPGDSVFIAEVSVPRPYLWSTADPHLYSVTVQLDTRDGIHSAISHRLTVRCGFRDFRVENGYFRLNGKRIFLRSTHTCNHFPVGQQMTRNPELVRCDLIFAKSSGFNMVRFIAGTALPEQLDFCDEIGLMVYEEAYAAWCLEDSPKMAERYERSTFGMVLRDRNHPSVVIWGLFNETADGAVFRHGYSCLPVLRKLDETRLVLLGSGRWDCRLEIGSVSNPGGVTWEYAWGDEKPGAPAASRGGKPYLSSNDGGYIDGAGDAHVYPVVPQGREVNRFLRALGRDTKPVFLSEYGIGSLMDVISEYRGFQQENVRLDLDDAALIGDMARKLEEDWQRFGMQDVYPFPEDMLRESQRLHARQRSLCFDLVRSNPRICGYNLTGMLDHGITGEGLWTFWRKWKPEVFDAVADGWAPLRWCLFVEPMHGYTGRSIEIEAVLANEDVLEPGSYPACFRIMGPCGIVWEKCMTVDIPQPPAGGEGDLALPVLREEIIIDGDTGIYEFAASLLKGGNPAGGRLEFHLSDNDEMPVSDTAVVLLGIDERVETWLESRGILCTRFEESGSGKRQVVLVGDISKKECISADWEELIRRITEGSTVVFLSHRAFESDDDPVYRLPLDRKGRCYKFNDWLYHKECVAKQHFLFSGLQHRGIMDWDYYGPVIPHYIFTGQDIPDDVAAVAFAAGYSCPGGYASGVLMGTYDLGDGRFIINTFQILENIDRHPAADRLLLNIIGYAAQ